MTNKIINGSVTLEKIVNDYNEVKYQENVLPLTLYPFPRKNDPLKSRKTIKNENPILKKNSAISQCREFHKFIFMLSK